MSVWRAALVARPQQATTHAPRLLQPRARPLSARRAVTRAAAQIGHAAVTAEEGQQDAAGGDSADSRCSLDTFLSARGAAGLLGWDVILHDTGAVVGTVAEVLSTAGGEVVFDVSGGGSDTPDLALDPLAELLVLGALPGAEDDTPENVLLRVQGVGRQYQWHVFVPLVSALVPALEPHDRRVRIAPPAGLLELGERPHLLAWLKQQLQPYLGPMPSGGTSGARPQRMPGRSELLRQERADLVESITRAGGFAAVGAQLRLRGARKPPGYWDDVDILASELREFVDSHWTEHREPGPGEQVASDPYWYNDISGQLRWDPPPRQRSQDAGGSQQEPGEDDDVAFVDDDNGDDEDDDFTTDLVMPPLRTLIAGGRWDLASAVRMHGGSRAVAAQLGWAPAPRWVGRHLAAFDALADELRAFCADQEDDEDDDSTIANDDDQGVMPTASALRAADRPDLLEAVRRHGGITAVAARLGWRLERSPKGRWASPAVTAREVRAFLKARGKTGTPNRLPTRAELTAAGRHDLAYAVSRHGTAAVAAKLKLAPRRAAARPFRSAREFVHTLRLRTVTDWQAWCRTGARPVDIPSNPSVTYKDDGWAGWADFLTGTPAGSEPVRRRQRRSAAAVTALAQAIASRVDAS